MQIQFLGAAGTVTGSRFLVSEGESHVLIDCGLFQGVKQLRLRNWKPFPVAADKITAVILTHAHLDHSGYLPVLVNNGLKAPVYCTEPTRDLCEILLPDAGFIQEEDARYANRKGFSKHRPARPLYTEEEARRCCSVLTPVPFGEEIDLGDIHATLSPAGHILGAASVRLRTSDRSVLFSGDLGRDDDIVMQAPVRPAGADHVVIESTYGDRRHGARDAVEDLGNAIRPALERGGVVMIAAFAVGRTQAVLSALARMFDDGRLPRVPVHLNSPMAIDVTGLYQRHADQHRLGVEQCRAEFGIARRVHTPEESRELNTRGGPMIIVSASGMLTGGRILHHLKAFAPDPRNALVLPGYQAPGTRGGKLAAGTDTIKIHGQQVPVRAEVIALDGFSAHADADGLLAWLGALDPKPKSTFVVHGDLLASDALRARIGDELGIDACVPEQGETVELD